MNIWFTADTHFGHTRIIEFAKRPFANITEMDEAIIENWNSRVGKRDLVYHLGDFALMQKTSEQIEAYTKRLKGQIHLIFGNHDHKRTRKAKGFAQVIEMKKLRIGEQRIVLCHYAMKVWNRSHRGAWQLYGHSHGTLPNDKTHKQFDVGVDCWNFRPIHFDEVAKEMEQYKAEAVDHHRGDGE